MSVLSSYPSRSFPLLLSLYLLCGLLCPYSRPGSSSRTSGCAFICIIASNDCHHQTMLLVSFATRRKYDALCWLMPQANKSSTRQCNVGGGGWGMRLKISWRSEAVRFRLVSVLVSLTALTPPTPTCRHIRRTCVHVCACVCVCCDFVIKCDFIFRLGYFNLTSIGMQMRQQPLQGPKLQLKCIW